MLAQPVIDLINQTTNDTGNVTYLLPEVILAINDAQKAVCNHRYDACSSSSNALLVAGSKQSIPSTARRLMKHARNMGANGTTVGRAIRFVRMDYMDSFDFDWHTKTGADVVTIMYDEDIPSEYHIYPAPVSLPHYLEIKTADNPVDVVNGASDLGVSDTYSPVVVQWALFILFGRDAEESPNYARSLKHEQSFYKLLGIKTQSDMQSSPNG